MSHATAVFRCDAGPRIGGGHVMRCLALADALSDLGWRCAFATAADTASAVPALVRSGHRARTIDPEEDAVAPAHPESGADLAVVDHYGRDAAYEARLRPWARRVLAIDDLANRRHDCDVLVDPTHGRSAADYGALVPRGCTILAGADYALVRPSLRALRAKAVARRATGDGVQRILVSFGSTDPADATTLALAALQRVAADVAIDVVLGPAAPALDAVRRSVGALARARLHVDPPDIAALMAAADLAVGAPGGMSWERCVLGLPTLTITIAENQRAIAAALADAGATENLGWHGDLDAAAVAGRLSALIADNDRRRAMSAHAATICDGRGTFRIALALLPAAAARDGSPVRLRAAETADGAIMLEWQRDPSTRRLSRNPAPPEEREHFAWLARKLTDPHSLFAIVEHDGAAAGVLRLDRRADIGPAYEVSILTAPGKRGQGIASAALQLGRQLAPGATLVAEILPGNDSSLALFEAAGYVRGGDGLFRSMPATVS